MEKRVRKLRSKDFCAGGHLKVFASEDLEVLVGNRNGGKDRGNNGLQTVILKMLMKCSNKLLTQKIETFPDS